MTYDRAEENQHWKQVVFTEDRFLQSAELNEMQTIAKREVTNISKALIENGGILEGGNIFVNKSKVKIEKTMIFLEGNTIEISETILTVPSTGRFVIGSAIKETILTAEDNKSLRNPAIGTEGFNEVGADRLVVTGRWCAESEATQQEQFFETFVFQDGVLQSVKHIAPELEGFKKVIERFDRDANGSYVSDGLICSYEKDTATSHSISVSDGIAHVDGREIIFEYSQRVQVDRVTEFKEVFSEPHTFETNKYYKTRHYPIRNIERVVGVVELTESVVHGGYTNSSDAVAHSPVVKVVKITQDDEVYVEGKDFVLLNDKIDWKLDGKEPAPSSTYKIVYQYQKHIENVAHRADSFSLSGFKKGTPFLVTYSHFLKRKDTVVLTRKGEFKVVKGVADEFNPVATPINFGLSLATVEVAYNEKPKIFIEYTRSFKMGDVQVMAEDIQQIKYNQAKFALDYDARNSNPTLDKKGIFVDPFYDDDLRDDGMTQNAVVANESLMPNIDFEIHRFSNDVDYALPIRTNREIIVQDSRTNTRKVNAYITAKEAEQKMKVTPSSLRWITRTNYYYTRWGRSSTITKDVKKVVPVPQTELTLEAQSFSNEPVKIYMDKQHVKTVQSTPIVDNDGKYEIKTTFDTPPGLQSGRKLIEAIGQKTGLTVSSVWSAVPQERNITWRVYWYDPVAQTIMVEYDCFVSKISLYVENEGSSFVRVSIVETTVGIPDMKRIINSTSYLSKNVKRGWFGFEFPTASFLEEGKEYAIVVESGDGEAMVSTAKLGEYDKTHKKWMNSQAHGGVFLSSANSSTWSAFQKEDLAFKVHSPSFVSNKTFLIGKVTVKKCTDLYLLLAEDKKVGTNIVYTAFLKDRNERVHLSVEELKRIKEYSGVIELSATLSSTNANFTPFLDKDVALGVGTVSNVSTYFSRYFMANGDDVKVYLDIKEPSVKVNVYLKEDGNFKKLTRKNEENRYLENGFVETCFIGSTTSNSTQIKIEILKDFENPVCKNLRLIIS